MKILKAARLYCKTALPALLLATTVQADDSLDDFYVVELTIFTHEKSANATEEAWPDNIRLKLPPAEQRAWLAELEIADVYPQLADQIARALEPEPAEDGAPDQPAAALPDLDVSKASNQAADKKENAQAIEHFLPLLGKQYSEHDDAAHAIRYSSGKHRLLLHRTWLQKFTGKENAPAIILEAGNEQYGFHEVAGSITLFKSRFLHIKTHLWHLQFQDDKASEEKASVKLWPPVPEIVTPDTSSITGAAAGNEQQAVTAETAVATTDTTWTVEGLPPLQPDLANVALMEQQRRLRSREIHYIDHPLFGLIVEIRPFELPEPAASEEPATP